VVGEPTPKAKGEAYGTASVQKGDKIIPAGQKAIRGQKAYELLRSKKQDKTAALKDAAGRSLRGFGGCTGCTAESRGISVVDAGAQPESAPVAARPAIHLLGAAVSCATARFWLCRPHRPKRQRWHLEKDTSRASVLGCPALVTGDQRNLRYERASELTVIH